MTRHRIRIVASSATALLVTALLTLPAFARPFGNGDLFVGPSIKADSRDRFFFGGARFQVAPVKALIQSVVKKKVDEMAAQNPEQGAAIKEIAENVDTKQLRALADSGQLEDFKKTLAAELSKNGQAIPPEQQKVIDALDSEKIKSMADLIEMYQEPPETLTFSLEPYAGLNFKYLTISARVAIAGFTNPDTKATSMELGNLGLDLHTGNTHGNKALQFGWTVGVQGYGPTGTEDANRVALSNVLAAPAYLHEYASGAPYIVLGVGVPFLDFSVHAKYVMMFAAVDFNKNDPTFNQRLTYLHAGAALRANLGFMGASLEFDGLLDVGKVAPISNVFLLSAGLHGYVKFIQLGLGIQVPIVAPDADDSTVQMGGVAVGSMAGYNVLLNAQVNL